MKKIILTFVLGILLQSTYAQDKPDMPACIIVTGAYNLTAMEKTDYFFSADANPGFSGTAIIRSDGDLYALTGVEYVSVNPTLTNKLYAETEKINLKFLQLPIMGGFQVVKSNDSKKTMHVQLGGAFSSLLDVSENEIGIEENNLKQTGFTFRFGVGAELWNFVADINYNLLITHVYDLPGEFNKAKLMCWEFSIGYKFNLNEK